MWMVLVVGVGVSLFMLKYKVQALEDELVATNAQISRDRATIRVLEAEWTYLNDPERLRRLSEQHLGLQPPAPEHIATISSLPFRATVEGAPVADGVSVPAPQTPVFPAATTQSTDASHTNRPSEQPGTFARIQRLLRPVLAGVSSAEAAQ